jgi:hypothetical protein
VVGQPILGLSFGPVGHAYGREWYVSAAALLGGDGNASVERSSTQVSRTRRFMKMKPGRLNRSSIKQISRYSEQI